MGMVRGLSVLLLSVLLPAATLAQTPLPTPHTVCIGDCDGDGAVEVNELVLIVGIALNGLPASGVDPCPSATCADQCCYPSEICDLEFVSVPYGTLSTAAARSFSSLALLATRCTAPAVAARSRRVRPTGGRPDVGRDVLGVVEEVRLGAWRSTDSNTSMRAFTRWQGKRPPSSDFGGGEAASARVRTLMLNAPRT